jgi:hypothetical protein
VTKPSDKAIAGLGKALGMTADELSAKMGEDNLLVQVKRNRERLSRCDRHEFERQPDWVPFDRRKARCTRCGGEMDRVDATHYLRGFAHGSGADYDKLVESIWPSKASA